MSSSLIFFGQGGELFMGEDGTAEERLKSLLGDSSDRGGLVRRRIVRRPLSSGYQAQPMVYSEVTLGPCAGQSRKRLRREVWVKAFSIPRIAA